uniref:Thioredoxin domain-containing protein n=1 Tax=Xiphophorus couchianus TaxID=32473 RepID=A0A3B5LKP8_9TELE
MMRAERKACFCLRTSSLICSSGSKDSSSISPAEIMSTLCFSWKDLNNDFKKTLKLTGVPTLLRYGTPQKLVEEECFKPDLVKMMFTED